MLKTIVTPDKEEWTEEIVTGDAWIELVNRKKEENAGYPPKGEEKFIVQESQEKFINQNQDLNWEKIKKERDYFYEDGLLKGGGRLTRASLTYGRKHPVVLFPSYATDCLIGYIHAKLAAHQGRHMTAGAIRDAGYLVSGGKRKIQKMINQCQVCRRLRANPQVPRMSDLPTTRTENTAPFQSIGIDVFGPFKILYGRSTRSHSGSTKRWVLLITCLFSRAIHLEFLEEMSTDSFRMAFSRFTGRRGKGHYIKSDAGSNFMGARNEDESLISDRLKEELESELQYSRKMRPVTQGSLSVQ